MPLYTVSSHSPFTQKEQSDLVHAITQVHCEATGAPAQFVQVIFSRGVKLRKKYALHILGSIRSGRSAAIKERLISGFKSAAAQVQNHTPQGCHVELLDVPASWVIEGGDIMPEPGEEAAWLARQASAK